MFGTLVILYLFLGGASAGAFLVMSAWSLAYHHGGHEERSYRFHRAFKMLIARCYTISLILLAFSILCLLWDLYYPERVLLLFTRPRLTVLTFGAFVLSLQAVIGLLLALANTFDLELIGSTARKVLECLCCVCSVAVMAYTGVYLVSNMSIPFWNTWTLVALFFFSSLSGGISIVLLIDYFIKDQTLLLRAARPLQRVHLACLTGEALSLAAFMGVGLANESAAKSIALLTQPSMLSTAVMGVVVMGMAVPALLETYTLRKKECRTIPVSDVVCLMGGLALRYCIVMCGVH